MYYAYILQSEPFPGETYIGSTSDLKRRFADHNAGKSAHTNKFKPWRLAVYIAFPERPAADRFERYLKSGSGRAFTARHLIKPANGKI